MKKKLVLSALLAAMALPGAALAGMAATTLDEMVITASRVEESKKDVTANIVVISQEEIKSSSARDLGDLLADLNVGHIHKYPGSLTSVGIRGFKTESHGNDLRGHILLLLDGRRSGTGNLAQIMTKNIERVEIIRGPAGVQYGSAGMGGVINVITKQGKDVPEFFVEGGLGSYGYEEMSVGFSAKVKGVDFSGSISESSMDDYDTGDGDKFHNTGYDKRTNASVNLGYEFLPNNRFGIIYTDFDSDKAGNPGNIAKNDLDNFSNKENHSVDFTYEGATADKRFSWMGRYFFGEDTSEWHDPVASNPTFWDNGIPSKRDTDSQGAQAQVTGNFGSTLLTAGIDWADYEVDTSWSAMETEYDSLAYILLGKTKFLNDRLIFTGGLRFDSYELDMSGDSGGEQDDDDLNVTAGVAYLLNDNVKLRVNYGEAFVIPDADQLSADYVSGSTHYLGNPDLDPEKSKTYEAGVDFIFDASKASVTYFYTDFEDKIVSVKHDGVKTWKNLGEATIRGCEGDFSTDLGALFSWGFGLEAYGNIVYLDEYEDDETGDDLLYISDINASYGLKFSDLNGFNAKLNFAYTGEQTVTDYSSWPYSDVKKGGFTIADLTLEKELFQKEGAGALSLRGEIDNLFDKDYAYVLGYPMPGRTFFVGLKYTY
ncbi:MAG: TonB-dependent receptor [Desulfuromonas sp.]|nr:TonB-dependent receptor [Desulfuromonas sp.]